MSTSVNSPVLARLPAASSDGRPGSLIHFNTVKTIPPFNTKITALPSSTRCQSETITETSMSKPTEMKKIARNKSLNGRMSDRIRWL